MLANNNGKNMVRVAFAMGNKSKKTALPKFFIE